MTTSACASSCASHATSISPANSTHNRPHDTGSAAQFLGLSKSILNKWRVSGRGPMFRKFGSRVVYLEGDLQSWSDSQCRRSTSDAGVRA
jgi:hypothetical protein